MHFVLRRFGSWPCKTNHFKSSTWLDNWCWVRVKQFPLAFEIQRTALQKLAFNVVQFIWETNSGAWPSFIETISYNISYFGVCSDTYWGLQQPVPELFPASACSCPPRPTSGSHSDPRTQFEPPPPPQTARWSQMLRKWPDGMACWMSFQHEP